MQKTLDAFATKTMWMVLPMMIVMFACGQPSPQQQPPHSIRLNQAGFYTYGPKTAVVLQSRAGQFQVMTADGKKTVYTGELSNSRISQFSKKETRLADFTAVTTPGTYVLHVEGAGHSYPFEINDNIHHEIASATIKGFYFQRASTALQERHAGMWRRPSAHPDTVVYVHRSAATTLRPEGTVISSPRGWYDAGDYNKYIVNSGITMGTLLSLYEDHPDYVDDLRLNIPESDNTIPDLLDEVLWNLRWMLTMQDFDGGVYHKLTNANFDGMVMPHKATAKRYVVQKSTAASLDFAAVMAQAARVFRKFDGELPGLADSCLVAARKAWDWAQQNPAVAYKQREINQTHDPAIQTGEYGDNFLSDEFIWAALELFVTTKDDSYYHAVNTIPDNQMPLPSWGQVRLLGYYTLIRFRSQLSGTAVEDVTEIEKRLTGFADKLIAGAGSSAYATIMGQSQQDFVWGSNAVAANQGIALLQVYRITKDKRYVDHALSNLDYLLGRNATGYCFVTGCGDKPPMHPHHRPSEADGIDDPVPGLLAGGPNPSRQDKCQYPSTDADEAYSDDVCSYASNEIAINWNAPLAYLASAIEALQSEAGYKR